jgi:hypothetical protein
LTLTLERCRLKLGEREIQRCVAEQRLCADYLAGGGPDSRGAMAGARDWLMEEAILRAEAKESQ